MSGQVFVDESRRSGCYLLAASELAANDLGITRSALRALCLPGMRRVHFQAEGDNRRREVLSALLSTPSRVTIYQGRGPSEAVRAACLRVLVEDMMENDARRLVLESRGEPGDRMDRQMIAAALRALGTKRDQFSYVHLRPHEEPALWISDAVAWCHGAGSHWRLRAAPLIKEIVDLPPSARGLRARPGQREARAPVVRRVLPGLTSST